MYMCVYIYIYILLLLLSLLLSLVTMSKFWLAKSPGCRSQTCKTITYHNRLLAGFQAPGPSIENIEII